MSPTFVQHRFLHFSKILFNVLVLTSLALSGLPLNAAQAAPAKLPSPSTGPVPSATLGIDTYERTLVGDNFDFWVSFSNPNLNTVGYGPFVDLVLPTNGADGAPNPDGISFVGATFNGSALTASAPLTFPDGALATPPTPGKGCVSHPFAVDSTGTPLQVCGTTGDTLVVLELPFSSVTNTMPSLSIDVTAKISDLADVETPLNIVARGGYRYGADSLDNPAVDAPIVSPSSTDSTTWPSLAVTPHAIYISKSNSGLAECPYLGPSETVLDPTQCPYADVNPVYENVTGPNFPLSYTITLETAPVGSFANIKVTDTLPNNIVVLSTPGVTTSGGSGVTITPPTYDLPVNSNALAVTFGSVIAGTTVSITVPFYIPQNDANGTPVLDPTTGASVAIDNSASGVGDWTPLDPRDQPAPTGNAIANSGVNELNARSTAVQKSIDTVPSPAPGEPPVYAPGTIVKYTLNFEISDYFSYGNLVLTDNLTDGQVLDSTDPGTTAPTFSVTDHNTNIPALTAFPPADMTVSASSAPDPDTTSHYATTIQFNLSPAMIAAGAADGVLDGGEIGVVPPALPNAPAIGTITYYAKVQETFTKSYVDPVDSSVENANVDAGDEFYNNVVISGAINGTGNTQTNDSTQKFEIESGQFSTEVYAVNGTTSYPTTGPHNLPYIKPGDTITFRLRQDLPTTDSEDLTLSDFVPMPILASTEVATFDAGAASATTPAAGHAKFGPTDTLGHTPTITSSAADNSLTFEFGALSDNTDAVKQVDILYTLTMNNLPYADNATLTNLSTTLQDTTNNPDPYELFCIDTAQFIVLEPAMYIRKGAVASSNPAAVFVPATPAPVTFTTGASPAWSGKIASVDNNPSTDIINSDVQQVLPGDTVTFAVVLENLGHSASGAFDIKVKDSLPAGMQIPAGGINLQVRRGDGTALTSSPVGAATTDPSGLFDAGIAIANESPTQGAAHVYDATSGTNIIVISYDLTIATGQSSGSKLVNTATLLNYSSTTPSGPNYVGNTPTSIVNTDDATVTLPDAAPVITQGANATVTMSEDNSPTPFSLKLNATDANGDPLTWSIMSAPIYGTAGVGTLGGSTVVSYTPFLNYSGADSFIVQVSDGTLTDSINIHVTIQPVQQQSDLIWNQSYGIKYDNWIGVQDGNALGGGYREARSGAFLATPPQKFSAITWVTYTGPDQGKAKVIVDGKLKQTIDLYSPTANWQHPVVIGGLANKKHTILIQATNTHNPHSTDSWVVVDGFKIGPSIFLDDNDININSLYTYGSWLGLRNPSARFVGYRISTVKNSTMQFSFLGTRFNWVTARGPQYGRAAVYVDGHLVKIVDLYNATTQWRYRFTFANIGYGNHVIMIKVLHAKSAASKGFGVVCDGFEIY